MSRGNCNSHCIWEQHSRRDHVRDLLLTNADIDDAIRSLLGTLQKTGSRLLQKSKGARRQLADVYQPGQCICTNPANFSWGEESFTASMPLVIAYRYGKRHRILRRIAQPRPAIIRLLACIKQPYSGFATSSISQTFACCIAFQVRDVENVPKRQERNRFPIRRHLIQLS